MKMIRLAAFAVAVAAAAMSIGSAGASTATSGQTVDLSTDQAVVSYLTSLGIDPTGVVIQRGALNYAGPSCPGAGWNCTTATKVVQVASAGGSNVGECTDRPPPGPGPPQNCTIVQAPTDTSADNHATCIEKSDDPAAVQSCDITQTSEAGDNHAVVEQVVHNDLVGSTQSGQQDASITQTSTTGVNVANWQQTIHFTSHDHSGPSTESQDGFQRAVINQNSSSGDSSSDGTQFEHFTQDAHDGMIKQGQNATTTSASPFGDCHPDSSTPAAAQVTAPNSCALVTQGSGSGKLDSKVDQMNHLQLNAHSDGEITQNQGLPAGGLDLGVDQHSSGVATNQNAQHEHFQANGATPVNLKQFQHGPVAGNGSPDLNQDTNPIDRADFDQKSKLEATGTSQPTNDTVLIPDSTLLVNDENALLNALAGTLPALVPLEDGGDMLVQDSSGGLHYTTTGNATGSADFSTNTGHAKDTESGPVITIESRCGGVDPPNTGTCTSGPPVD